MTQDLKECPHCHAKMVYKWNKKGENNFWGCPNFPKCKESQSIK